MWAITSFFNPCGYRRRLANYREFRKRLEIPLVAVELGYQSSFELRPGDADILVQLRGGDILWQKERLLTLALREVPPECQKVIWLDCDLIFHRRDSIESTERLLDKFDLVQPFDTVYDLDRDEPIRASAVRCPRSATSLASAVAQGMKPIDAFRVRPRGRNQRTAAVAGFGWAFRRQLIEQLGFYAGGVLGGNDRVMACAAYGEFEFGRQNWGMNEQQWNHYLAWAEPFFERVSGNVGCAEGRLFHLWHGDLSNRRYRERHQGLARFDFNPYHDIRLDQTGCWSWSSPKPAMHDYVRNYFFSRKEDQ